MASVHKFSKDTWSEWSPLALEGDLGKVAKSLTLQATIGEEGAVAAQKRPVLVFFSGFQASASWYSHIVEKLANTGYVVIQYDTPIVIELNNFMFRKTLRFEDEIAIFPLLVKWLKEQNETGTSWLHGRLDLTRLAVGGHSRGGKLAALIFAKSAGNKEEWKDFDVRAAYLLDPIDELNPKAVKELKTIQKTRGPLQLGITGAGATNGLFNPKRSNFQTFEVAAPGSQVKVLDGVPHLKFCDAGPSINRVLDFIDSIRPDDIKEWLRGLVQRDGLRILLALSTLPGPDVKKTLAMNDRPGCAQLVEIAKKLGNKVTVHLTEAPEGMSREEVAETSAAQMAAWLNAKLAWQPGAVGAVGARAVPPRRREEVPDRAKRPRVGAGAAALGAT